MSIFGLRSSSIGKGHHVRIGIACGRMVRPGQLGDSPLFIVNIVFHVSLTCSRFLYDYRRCVSNSLQAHAFQRITPDWFAYSGQWFLRLYMYIHSKTIKVFQSATGFFPAFCPVFGFQHAINALLMLFQSCIHFG